MIRREDYKAIKRMNREQMSEYLNRVYKRGFDAGKESVAAHQIKANPDSLPIESDVPAEKEE